MLPRIGDVQVEPVRVGFFLKRGRMFASLRLRKAGMRLLIMLPRRIDHARLTYCAPWLGRHEQDPARDDAAVGGGGRWRRALVAGGVVRIIGGVRWVSVNGPLAEVFRYNRWANERIVDACRGLTDEQLDAHVAGAEERNVRETVFHVAAGQLDFLARLQGQGARLCPGARVGGVRRPCGHHGAGE